MVKRRIGKRYRDIITIKKVVEVYSKGGIGAVKILLQSPYHDSEWLKKIKGLLDNNCTVSAEDEIRLVAANILLLKDFDTETLNYKEEHE